MSRCCAHGSKVATGFCTATALQPAPLSDTRIWHQVPAGLLLAVHLARGGRSCHAFAFVRVTLQLCVPLRCPNVATCHLTTTGQTCGSAHTEDQNLPYPSPVSTAKILV
jgi:hypothetical protein